MNRWLMLGLLVIGAAAVAIAIAAGRDEGKKSSSSSSSSGAAPAATGVTSDLPLPTRPGRITGFVRDINGGPVPGALVRTQAGNARARTSSSGRYSLRASAGRHTVVATRAGYTLESIPTVLHRGSGARVDFSLGITAPGRIRAPNSADRMLVWTGCDNLAALSDAELDRWIARGADGFVCQTHQLFGLGGDQAFTAGSRRGLSPGSVRLQRALEASPAVRRARQGKLLLYLAFYAVNYYNTRTPFADWFDDRGWSHKVLPRVRALAAAAKSMSFTGLAIDQELYPQAGGVGTASWLVHYPGNTHSEAAVRAKVRQRGRELMQSMLSGFPGLELVAYGTVTPQSWYEKVLDVVDHQPNAFRDDVRVDLWDGLSSVPGYSAIRWLDAVFYKTFHLSGATWDTALQYNAERTYSYLSRRFTNWAYASSRLQLSPFVWIDAGTTQFEQARPPQAVAQQLEAAKRWGAGGVFGDYAYEGLGNRFDYAAYENAMRQASSPEQVDQQPPSITITSPQGTAGTVRAGKTLSLRGVANDNFAVRAVRWYDNRGDQGTARMSWTFAANDMANWHGEMHWAIDGLKVPAGARWITISAIDIHGLARNVRLTAVR